MIIFFHQILNNFMERIKNHLNRISNLLIYNFTLSFENIWRVNKSSWSSPPFPNSCLVLVMGSGNQILTFLTPKPLWFSKSEKWYLNPTPIWLLKYPSPSIEIHLGLQKNPKTEEISNIFDPTPTETHLL